MNSKKSWHPNTMKNQERVWKAEQAAAEEKKRMIELQREHAEERDRSELNNLMKHGSTSANDNRLSWMYDKPDKKVEQEAYLLGKSLDKSADQSEKPEQDAIPAVSRRVVGSSMITAAGDTQVDMSRKIREDPLLLIKERERAARAALLNNPLQRRKLAELLRKEQDAKKESKSKKAPKKKDKNLDDLLAAKLNALGGKKGLDLATLLNSDDSSVESSPEVKKQKKKKKEKRQKSKKKKKEHKDSSSDEEQSKKESSPEVQKSSKRSADYHSDKKYSIDSRKRQSSESGKYGEDEVKSKKDRRNSPEQNRKEYTRYYDQGYYTSTRSYKEEYSSKHDSGRRYPREDDRRNRDSDQREGRKRGGMTEEEKAARLAEMAAAGAEREIERGRRVAEQRSADARAEKAALVPRISSHSDARALPDSLESRIHSNRHYIQRDKRHMNENFARR